MTICGTHDYRYHVHIACLVCENCGYEYPDTDRIAKAIGRVLLADNANRLPLNSHEM